MKRLIYLAMTALVAMLVLVPAALAQDLVPGDDDPHMPENAVVVGHEELQQIAAQPLPAQAPTQQHPEQVPAAPTQEGLPATGGPSVILSAAALLLVGSGILAYAALRRRSSL